MHNEQKLTKVFFDMETRGILVDPTYIKRALQHEHQKITEAKESFKKDTGRPYKDSSKLFAEVFTARGESFPSTPKGNPSFKSEVLGSIRSPLANIIQAVREHEKRAGTYYSSFLYHMDSNRRIHAVVNQAGTTTGRLSYRDPNLQNVPKEDDEEDAQKEFVVRGSFVPTEDHHFVSFDYDQMEYKLMLDYSGEMGLIRQVLEGEDLHQATANMVGTTRKYAKTLNFAILYGAGPAKIAVMLGISVKEAQELVAKYFGKLPKVSSLIKRVRATGTSRGHIFNWYGRKYYISSREFAYKLPNHLIQGGCAEVIKLAMPIVHEKLSNLKSGLVLQIHDDLLHEIHKDELDIIPEIKRIMESIYTPKNGMNLTVSPEISKKSWAYRDFEAWEC
jgi:DNA polymerase-1